MLVWTRPLKLKREFKNRKCNFNTCRYPHAEKTIPLYFSNIKEEEKEKQQESGVRKIKLGH